MLTPTELVALAQANEPAYLERAIAANEGMMVTVLNQTWVSGLDRDELKSELKLDLIKQIRAYNENKGEWGHYAFRCLKNHCRNLINQRRGCMRWMGDAHKSELFDVHVGATGTKAEFDLQWPLPCLTMRESVCLELYYMHGYIYKHVGHVVGVSQAYAQVLCAGGLTKAKKWLDGERERRQEAKRPT